MQKIHAWHPLIIVGLSVFLIHLAGLAGTKLIATQFGWGDGILALDENASPDQLFSRFVRWDSGYYLMIAESGYTQDGAQAAFFPLYPILTRIIGQATGISIIGSGLLVSILSFMGGMLFLYRWVLLSNGQRTAFWAVIWCSFFPMAFFFTAYYAEPLFFFLTAVCAYFARRGKFISSGVAIALAGATRPTAFLLSIFYIGEFIEQKDFSRKKLLTGLLGAIVAPLGLFLYLFFLSHLRGASNLFEAYASNLISEWEWSFVWPWNTVYQAIRSAVFGIGVGADWFSRVLVWQDLFFTLFGLGCGIYALRWMRRSSALFLLISALFLASNHGPAGYVFWSLPRNLLLLVPMYLAIAHFSLKLPVWLRWLLLFVSIGYLLLMAAWFASGRWVA